MENRLYDYMDWPAIEGIVYSDQASPKDIMGPRLTSDGLLVQGFFPGADYDYKALKKKEPSALMTVPVLILTVLTVFMGLFPGQLISWIQQAVTKLI